MDDALPMGQEEDYETLRQIGIAAELLVLWGQRDQPDYARRAVEFERSHKYLDIVTGLLHAAEFFGRAHGEEPYMNTLKSWQMAAEMADAVRPVAEDEGYTP